MNRVERVSDSLQFTSQRNRYLFTAPGDGRYRFEMAELRNNAGVYLSAYNYLGETIAGQYTQNGQGLTLNLAGGQTYELRVRQNNGFSPYTLIIAKQ